MPAADSPPCNFGMRLPPGALERESGRPGATIDACGRLRLDPGRTLSSLPRLDDIAVTANARIDSMMIYATIFNYNESYSPGGNFHLVAHAERYYLDNGSSWESGAGSLYPTLVRFDHVEASGETLRYVLTPQADGMLYRQIDFDSGDHSAQGEITVEGPLVLVALAGATQGTLMGKGRIVSNDATWYGEPRFNYYQAPVGSLVPFRMRYRLASGSFTSNLFSTSFSYNGTGALDFMHATRPPVIAVDIKGPSRIPDQTSVPYRAIARYEGGPLVDVTEQAAWSVTPGDRATIDRGVLSVGVIQGSETFTIHAEYDEGGHHVEDDAQVVSRHDFFASDQTAWPMYQADSRHTGFLPVTPNPARFQLLWQRNLGTPLNPVAAGDRRVFCTTVTYFSSDSPLYALDAATGATLWSTNFGGVFSVNPPSYAYGNVYVQTGNHASDTWLHAFDGQTGERVFRSPHSAQWERYYAPTIHEGKVYVNGGSYGGMYAFDALTGGQLWFGGTLPQYDQWTPGIGGEYAYAYVGSYSPGLYALRRSDGQQVFMIPDPQFEWNGWSMNLAPVVGAHDDVLAIHDDRLISFDVAARRIRWQLASAFSGQPSLANDIIYAINGGTLVALNELTGVQIWSWTSPSGPLQEALVVTSSLAFVSSTTRTYAVSLDARSALWSYSVAGHLAIGNGALYVASSSGLLSAFDAGIGPPLVAHAGADTTVECAAAVGGTHVALDGSASEGPDLEFEWSAPGVSFDDAHSVTPVGTFPLGVTEVVLSVSRDGNVDRDTVVVTVRDTTSPTLGLAFEPPMLWPPDNQLVHVHVVAAPEDACDPQPAVKLLSVTSSESDGGHGDPFPVDILDASVGQPDFDVWLRAQRNPGGEGRAYTLCYEVRDATGHAVEQCASIVAPRSRGRVALAAGEPARLTIFGAPGMPVSHIDPSSIVVMASGRDLFRAASEPGTDGDVDQDGRTDRTWTLMSVEGADAAATAGASLYARWRADNDGYYAQIPAAGVTAVGADDGRLWVAPASNPARGRAKLAYEVPAEGWTRLVIYDLAGRVVSKLVDGSVPAGRHEAVFEPRGPMSGGLLFYRLEWKGQLRSGRFVLMP
jgi:outer membrane protein assembly factor BamB